VSLATKPGFSRIFFARPSSARSDASIGMAVATAFIRGTPLACRVHSSWQRRA
jgi:hypothetical protein